MPLDGDIMKSERELEAYAVEVSDQTEVREGVPLPLGTFAFDGGVNFAFFSRHATRVRIEFFDGSEDTQPRRTIDLDRQRNCTGDVWHVWVGHVPFGQFYAYRVDGPDKPQQGHRFSFENRLLDPIATAIVGDKCVFVGEQFHWKDVRPPNRDWSETIIYETHVRGLTIDASSGVTHPGTYRGLIEKIPYLKQLGVTAIELMPVQEFDTHQVARINPITGQQLTNYWGYDPVAFFAPKGTYSSSGSHGQQKLEFKEMVRACHEAGVEVILDVVFNHTGEGNEHGPTFSYRGIDNSIYYMLGEDKQRYKDFTGCGNTVNANHPIVREHILSALRHWVIEMHVDGFRFDLAAVLGRDEEGNLHANAPLLEQIAEDPIMRDVKIIAEAWDAAGAYEVGSFSERRWSEWNGRYRDDVRRFWRGDDGMLGMFASRLCGSADVYSASGKGPECSINFISCHDGFTLHDWVTYRDKHNEDNGENNHDGTNANYSDNHGVEGETDNAMINEIRTRQVRNMLLTLFVSRGVPMLLGGDEFRRTQGGNNNAWCQDNATSWFDWKRLELHSETFQFVRMMIAFRQKHPILSAEHFYSDGECHWFGPHGGSPSWLDQSAKQFGWLIHEDSTNAIYMMFNASMEATNFHLPAAPSGSEWQVVIDTAGLKIGETAGEHYLASKSAAIAVSTSHDKR